MTPLSASIRDFAARIAAVEASDAPAACHLEVDGERIALTRSAVDALCQLLDGYADPRDHGDCEACGGRRIDSNFICQACGHANGVFGQMLREHYTGFSGARQTPSYKLQSRRNGPESGSPAP